MNIRKIVTYNTLRRGFTTDELAFADALFNATESEREMLIGALQPEKPAGKKATKSTPRKIRHCAVCNWTKRAALHKDTTRDDYHEFVLSLPEPSKPNGKPVPKSSRASGMAAQLNKSLGQQRAVTTKDDNYDPESERCTFPRDDGKLCFLLPDHNVHHMKSAVGFHSFQSSSDALTAPTRSPANGGVGSTTANSGTVTDDAGVVAHGASGGD